MGTNYYAVVNPCETCGKPDMKLHIGKSSVGWTFTFQGFKNNYDGLPFGIERILSYKGWLKLLRKKGVYIKNEYGKRVSLSKFISMVFCKKGEKNNHAKQFPDRNWLDEEGNSFSEGDFC